MSQFFNSPFVWFTGVVEDRNDPQQAGRFRVRIFGLHTFNKSDLPTEDLPWATPILPVSASSVSGIGVNPSVMTGAWVIGFFRDSSSAQDPMIFGTIPTMSGKKGPPSEGFNDPTNAYPRNEFLAEPDLNRRTRGENTTEKPPSIDEPDDVFKAKYPYNQVIETESGHIIEYDDTPGAERINIQHRMGTFIEMHPNGDIRMRSKDRYEACKNLRVTVDGNATVSVSGNSLTTVYGTTTLNSVGDLAINTTGNMDIAATGNITMKASGTLDIGSTGALSVQTKAALKQLAGAGSTYSSGGGMTLDAPTINLNSGSTTSPSVDVNVEIEQPDLYVEPIPERFSAAPLSAPASTTSGDSSIPVYGDDAMSEAENPIIQGDTESGFTPVPQQEEQPRELPPRVDGRVTPPESIANDEDFQGQLDHMVAKYPGLTRDQVYAVMRGESAYNPQARNPQTNASGLFQFMPATAKGLGTSTDRIRQMTPGDQLRVYEKYLDQFDYQGGDLGIMQAAPAYGDAPPDRVIYRRGGAAWRQNPGWRPADGGDITVQSINDYYNKQYGL
jgi:hypothetical protein